MTAEWCSAACSTLQLAAVCPRAHPIIGLQLQEAAAAATTAALHWSHTTNQMHDVFRVDISEKISRIKLCIRKHTIFIQLHPHIII